MGDKLLMTVKERMILHELKNHLEDKQTLKESAEKCGISERHMKRKKKIYLNEGDKGILHKSRGKPSNRSYDKEFRKTITSLYSEKYLGFGPTLASEKLAKNGYYINKETLRLWLLDEGLWYKKRKRKIHRKRRERKQHFGEMVQIDGSFHDWFGTGEKQCMMVMVDDATGDTLSLLSKEETTKAAITILKLWIEMYGIPRSLYGDKKSVYYTDRDLTLEESLRGEKPLTQFGKCCRKLDIDIIAAHSPQAKGRVERKNGVLQDRLVKEFKLQEIEDMNTANLFMLDGFLNELNTRFSVTPVSDVDYHRPLSKDTSLNEVFSLEVYRTVKNDWTVRYQNRFYQIDRKNNCLPPCGSKVIMQTRLDGTLFMIYRGETVLYTVIQSMSEYKDYSQKRHKPVACSLPKVHKPGVDHPWRKPFLSHQNRHAL